MLISRTNNQLFILLIKHKSNYKYISIICSLAPMYIHTYLKRIRNSY